MKIVVLIFSILLPVVSNAQIGLSNGRTIFKGTTAENAYPVLVASVESLDRVMPTLTPKEKEWVISEQKEMLGSSARLTKLVKSKEYNLFYIREYIDAMKTYLNEIKNARISGDHKKEIYSWVQVCMSLDQNNMEQYLSNYVDKSPIVFEEESFLFILKDKTVHVGWSSWSQAIWEGFLKEDLKLALKLEDR